MKLSTSIMTLVLGLAAQVAQADPITYTIDRTIGAGSAIGTLTTDGKIGTLSVADILSWTITINEGDGSGPFQLTTADSHVQIIGSLLTASETALSFLFGGSKGYMLIQSPTTGSGVNWWCVEGQSSACAGSGGGETVNRLGSTWDYQAINTTQVIGTLGNAGEIPEPGSLALLGVAVGALALSRRRI